MKTNQYRSHTVRNLILALIATLVVAFLSKIKGIPVTILDLAMVPPGIFLMGIAIYGTLFSMKT